VTGAEKVGEPEDRENARPIGMLMDDVASAARFNLTQPLEAPPLDVEVFETHFALLEDMDRGRFKEAETSGGTGTQDTRELREARPD
jgi:hypothetical protein